MQDISFMVKYCGGCNSYYDRGKIVKKIEKNISIKIIPYNNKIVPDLLLIMKGCKAECVSKVKYKSKYGVLVLEDEKDFQGLLDKIKLKIKKIDSKGL